jgi:uncharacterized protein YjbI with pentapeptide repeats
MEHDKCTFKQEYYDFKTKKKEIFHCKIEHVENKKFCLFHDETYLEDPKNKDNVITKLKDRIEDSISQNEHLLCIGYYLPDIKINREFKQPVYFNYCKFQKANFSGAIFSAEANFSRATLVEANFSRAIFSAEANFSGSTLVKAYFFEAKLVKATFSGFKLSKAYFSGATFSDKANFSGATFSDKANFSGAKFSDKAYFFGATLVEANFSGAIFSAEAHFTGNFQNVTYFNYSTFEKPNEVRFEIKDMSLVSFMNTDITGIRFSGKTRWSIDDQFKVVEEEELEIELEYCKNKRSNLEEILSVYRNLRENYEFRRRYDEAGKFFIREMEIKRKYREVKSKGSPDYEIKKNCWFRRNILSLTGWYHILSNYGESLWRPAVAGIIIILLATIFFACQSNPILEPTLSLTSGSIETNNNNHTSNVQNTHRNPIANSSFIDPTQIGNGEHLLKATERSLGDFLPLLSMPSDIKISLSDYIIKIVGGAVTFGLIAIALRRRFERKYTH